MRAAIGIARFLLPPIFGMPYINIYFVASLFGTQINLVSCGRNNPIILPARVMKRVRKKHSHYTYNYNIL